MSNFQIFLLVILASISLLFFIRHQKYKSEDRIFYPVLTYHKITGKFEWGITRVKPQSFEQHISYLKDEGFSSMDLEDLGLKKEENDKRVALTFDDGYESIYLNAFPILNQYGFTGTLFLITGYIGKKNSWEAGFGHKFMHLSWEQIQEMKNSGFQFGSHTVNHPDLTKLTKKSLEFELKKSKETIEEKLNQEVKYLSYPFGRHNQMVRTEAKNAGYNAAFSLTSELSEDPFAIGRMGVYLFDTPLSLRIKLSPKGLFWIEDLKGWIINQFATGTALVKRYK